MSTYTPIASITLSSTATSITFSGIPQTYTDLVLVANTIVASGTGNDVALRFNGDSGSNYSNTYMLGTGSTTISGRNSLTYSDNGYLDANSGNPNTRIINIPNYTNATTFKINTSRASGVNGGQTTAYVNTWRSNSAITSITVFSSFSLTYAVGTTFNLYGVANASLNNTAKATGGDIVTTDGTYWYHGFLSSGIFTPTQALTADYLVVAGGGSGAQYTGGDAGTGGGGAGGARSTVTSTGGGGALESPLSLLANTSYTVTIGAGGAGVFNADGNNGSNSVFATITSTGGGGGGRWAPVNPGKAGGSGGGSGAYTQVNTGGAGTAGQGYKGGDGSPSPSPGNNSAGGGGGAGSAGANGNNSGTPGAGGSGIWTALTNGIQTGQLSGGNYFVAAGGGSTGPSSGGSFKHRSLGGTGGGGNGGNATQTGSAGTANTGGGGGAQFDTSTNSFAGGSGIVIVRYAV